MASPSDAPAVARTATVPAVPLADLAARDLLRCDPADTVGTAARRMTETGCGAVFIAGEGEAPRGIWTRRDALGLDLSDPAVRSVPLHRVMNAPVRHLPGNATAAEAQAVMAEAGIRHLLVTDRWDAPLGVVSQTDLVLSHGVEAYLRLREVGSVARRDVVRLGPATPLSAAARRLADAGQQAALVAFDDGTHGVLTERDVVRVLGERDDDPAAGMVAGRPLVTVAADDALLNARERMIHRGIRRVGVVDADGTVTGLVGFDELMAAGEKDLVQSLEAVLEETRTALDAARGRAERFRAVQDQAPVGLLGLDDDGIVREANTTAFTLLGAPRDAVVGHPLADRLGAAGAAADLAALARGERDTVHHEVALSRTGAAVWVALTAARLRSGEGPDGISVVLSDITDRKAAEARAEAERARTREYLDGAPAMFLALDPGGRVREVNSRACELLGCDREAVVGRDWVATFVPAEGRDDVRGHFAAILDGGAGAPDAFENEVVTATGERRLMLFRNSLLRDARGSIEMVLAWGEDVTEWRRYQHQLERYKAIFDALPVGIYRNEPGREGCFGEVNPAMARIFGAESTDELLRHPTAELYRDPAARKRFSDNLLADGAVYRHALPLQTLDGEPLWCAVTAQRRTAPDGRTVFDGIVEDITEQKAAEETAESLRRRESFIQSVLGGFPDMIFHKTPDGVYVECNEEFGRLTGFAPAAVAGRTDYEIFSRETADFFRHHDHQMLALGEARHNEEWVQYPDGRWALLDMLKTPYRGDDGEIQGIIGIGRDITERSRIEESLRQSEARHRTITDDVLDNAVVGIFILDADFRVAWINHAIERYMGVGREAVVGADKRRLIHDHVRHILEDGDEFARRVINTYDDNTYVETFEVHVLPGEGRDERWLEHWSMPIQSGLYAGGRVEHYHDISQRKALETELRRANRDLEQFAYTASHNMGEPLRMVTTQLQRVRRDHGDALPEAGREALEMAAAGTRRLSALARALLAYSRIAVEGAPFRAVALGAVLADTRKALAGAIRDSGATITADAALPTVHGDAEQIHQLLHHLLGNAVRYRHPDRPPRIHLGAMPLPGRPGWVRIDVSDNGRGIDPADVDRLFDIFRRPDLHGSDTEGAGIGLALCKRIVERHGGRIDADGRPGEGTRFTFTLPRGA